MSTLFISHSSSDNTAAKELESRLEEKNHHSVFLDLDPEKGIVAGQSWEQTLYRKLRACRAVIALCSDHYLRSHWCFAEIALARMEGKHVIALMVDPLSADAKLPAILTEKQFIELRQDPEDGYRRLWQGLEELDLLGVTGEWDPKESPYLGLRAYQEKHATVFFGRGAEKRTGLELLDRGAPGLIMVLGSSGSGKSSLVRAGMIPRLRRDPDRWLVLDPFRPRRDPVAELAESFASAYRRFAPDQSARAGSRDRILEKLEAGLPRAPGADDEAATGNGTGEAEPPSDTDERLRQLLRQIEELRGSPPQGAGPPILQFLDWSLDDLRRICDPEPLASRAVVTGPGNSPLVEIADHLRRASGRRDARVLLVIDQFEELLGYHEPKDRANGFLKLLRDSIEIEHSPLMALGTMRSDFLGLFQRNRGLRDIDFESLSVGPMSVDAMRRVIEEPARLGAIELEDGLADRLLEDTETPDALPLLSFTLWRLWAEKMGGKLSVGQYEELGGLHGAVVREAESVLTSARQQGKEDEVRAAFLQMARLTEDGSYARQPVSWDRDELQRVRPILEAFEKRRLLVTRQEEGESPTIEVAHEALFRSWAPLKTWLDNNRSELLLKQQLRRDARVWDQSDRVADNLWRSGRLQQAAELMERDEPRTSKKVATVEGAFVRAGLRRRKVQRLTGFCIAAFFFVSLGAGLIFALQAKDEAQAQAQLARARQLVAQAESSRSEEPDRIQRSLLLAAEGLRRVRELDLYSVEADRLLRWGLGFLPRRLTQRRFGDFRTTIVAISPNSSYVATRREEWPSEGWIELWETENGERIAGWELSDPLPEVSFAPGDRLVAVGEGSVVQILGLPEGEEIAELHHDNGILTMAWDPEGRRIAVVPGMPSSGPGAETAHLWDAETGRHLAALPHESHVHTVAFDPVGVILATGTFQRAFLWDAATSEKLATLPHDASVTELFFTADSRHLATRSQETLHFWVTRGETEEVARIDGAGRIGALAAGGGRPGLVASSSGAMVEVRTPPEVAPKQSLEQVGAVTDLAISGSGRLLAARSGATVQLWNVRSEDELARIPVEGHYTVFGFGGKEVPFLGAGNRLLTWEIRAEADVAAVTHGGKSLSGIAFLAGGEELITATGGERKIRRWSLARRRLRTMRLKFDDGIADVSYQPGRGELAIAGSNGLLRVVGVDDLSVLAERDLAQQLNSVDLHPEGGLVAVGTSMHLLMGTGSNSLLVVPVTDGEPVLRVDFRDEVGGVAFSADGRLAAAASSDGVAAIGSIDGSIELRRFVHDGPLADIAFSPDGQLLATAGLGARNGVAAAHIWSLREGREQSRFEHEAAVSKVVFAPGGGYLATGSANGMARVWSLAAGELVSEVRHRQGIVDLSFSPDGRHLASADTSGEVRVWLWRPVDLLAEACSRFARNLTFQEWARYVGVEDPYRKTCPGELPVHPSLPATGRLLARRGEVEEGRAFLRRARELDPGSVVDTDSVLAVARADGSIERAGALAEAGKLDAARGLVREVFAALPELDSEAVASRLVGRVKGLVQRGQTLPAVNLLHVARDIHSAVALDGLSWNLLCWEGATKGLADKVLFACEAAVGAEPDNPYYRDSRALARALTGDLAGAAADFRAYVESGQNERRTEQKLRQRREWLHQLEQGEQPFTPEVLSELGQRRFE